MNKEITLTCVAVPVGGNPYIKHIENNLHALQAAVGGLIEVVRLSGDVLLICDEEAKLKDKDGNRRIGREIIAGDFIVVGDDGEHFRSLTQSEIDAVMKFFREPHHITSEEVEETLICRFVVFRPDYTE